MTIAEMQQWIIDHMSGSPKISPETMRNFFNMLKDNFIHLSNPLPCYTTQISDTDLNASLECPVTHGLGTLIPDAVMLDETGTMILEEYADLQVIDEDNVKLTFFDNIPTSGTGYYELVFFFITPSVPARYNTVFTSGFDAWTEGEPDNFVVNYGSYGTPTIADSSDRAELTADGNYKIQLRPVVTLVRNRVYKITVKIDLGNLVISSGGNRQTLNAPGTYVFLLTAGYETVYLQQGAAAVTIIDSILIQEEL